MKKGFYIAILLIFVIGGYFVFKDKKIESQRTFFIPQSVEDILKDPEFNAYTEDIQAIDKDFSSYKDHLAQYTDEKELRDEDKLKLTDELFDLSKKIQSLQDKVFTSTQDKNQAILSMEELYAYIRNDVPVEMAEMICVHCSVKKKKEKISDEILQKTFEEDLKKFQNTFQEKLASDPNIYHTQDGLIAFTLEGLNRIKNGRNGLKRPENLFKAIDETMNQIAQKEEISTDELIAEYAKHFGITEVTQDAIIGQLLARTSYLFSIYNLDQYRYADGASISWMSYDEVLDNLLEKHDATQLQNDFNKYNNMIAFLRYFDWPLFYEKSNIAAVPMNNDLISIFELARALNKRLS